MAVKDPKLPPSSSNRPPARTPGRPGDPTTRRADSPIADEAGPLSMTGIRTGMLNSLAVKLGLGALIAIFVAGFAISALTPAVDPETAAQTRPVGGGPDPVARVGDETIPRDLFQRSLAQQMQFSEMYGQKTSVTDLLATRSQVLETLAGEAAQVAEAKRRGITASEEDIEAYITKQIDKQFETRPGQTAASIRRQIESDSGLSVDAYKAKQREGYDRALVARAVLLEKLEKAVKDENKVTIEDYNRANTKLALRQIKISPKPDPKAKDPKVAQEKAEAGAKARAEKLAAQLKGKPASSFAQIAKAQSDDIATKTKGGDLGSKLATELPLSQNIKDALQKANGSLVGPLQDEYSKDQYLFFIAGRKLELPKADAKKKKAEVLKAFEEGKDNEAWQAYTTKLREGAKPVLEDPALVAYDIATKQVATAKPEEQKALREQAIAKYEEALNYAGGDEDVAIRYQMAQQYAQAGQPAKQLEALKAASDRSNDRTIDLQYAQTLLSSNKQAEALKLAQEISKDLDQNPSPPPQFSFGGQQNPDDATRFQIAGLFEQAGKKDLAAKERAKVKPPAPAPGAPGAGGAPGGLNLGNVDVGGGGKKTITLPPR
jgi:hypothetical protein